MVAVFESGRSNELGDDDLANVAASAVAGRVATMLTEADRLMPGRIYPKTGAINLDDSTAGDMLDDIAELVLRNGGQVVMVPAEQMPTRTELAAICCF